MLTSAGLKPHRSPDQFGFDASGSTRVGVCLSNFIFVSASNLHAVAPEWVLTSAGLKSNRSPDQFGFHALGSTRVGVCLSSFIFVSAGNLHAVAPE